MFKFVTQYSYFEQQRNFPNILLPKIWLTQPTSLRVPTLHAINNEFSLTQDCLHRAVARESQLGGGGGSGTALLRVDSQKDLELM